MIKSKLVFTSLVLLIAIILIPVSTKSQEFSILRSTLSVCGSNYQGKTYTLKQSIGQASITGTLSNNNISVIQGYIQPQFIIKNSTVEIEELDVDVKKISNEDKYIITVNEDLSPIRIDIYNTLGQKRFSQNTDPYEETYINLSSFSPGCYILKVQTNLKHFSTKLIKK